MREPGSTQGPERNEEPRYSLVDAFTAEPYPPAAIALCHWLAGVGPAPEPTPYVDRESVIAFGRRAAALHANRPGVLVALGRMFLAWRELSAALTTLVRAASMSPGEPIIFRLLGEVLFRRGDAERAKRVLERAIAAGIDDADTRAWYDAANAYCGQGSACTLGAPTAGLPPPPPPYAQALTVGATGYSSRPPPPSRSFTAPADDSYIGADSYVDPATFAEEVG